MMRDLRTLALWIAAICAIVAFMQWSGKTNAVAAWEANCRDIGDEAARHMNDMAEQTREVVQMVDAIIELCGPDA